MLTRELTEIQQIQVNQLENDIIYKKTNELKRGKFFDVVCFFKMICFLVESLYHSIYINIYI